MKSQIDVMQKSVNDITIYIDNEEYKTGKFILFQSTLIANNYYLEFQIKTDKKIEPVKIPYPFNIENYEDEGLLYFDFLFNYFQIYRFWWSFYRSRKHTKLPVSANDRYI